MNSQLDFKITTFSKANINFSIGMHLTATNNCRWQGNIKFCIFKKPFAGIDG
jgi:hypothetical protein